MTDVLDAPFQVSSTHTLRLADGQCATVDVDVLVDAALEALNARVARTQTIDGPTAAKKYFALHLGRYEHEVFAVLFLDAQHRVISMRKMFHGTLSQTSVIRARSSARR